MLQVRAWIKHQKTCYRVEDTVSACPDPPPQAMHHPAAACCEWWLLAAHSCPLLWTAATLTPQLRKAALPRRLYQVLCRQTFNHWFSGNEGWRSPGKWVTFHGLNTPTTVDIKLPM